MMDLLVNTSGGQNLTQVYEIMKTVRGVGFTLVFTGKNSNGLRCRFASSKL
jgi:hypothetical protein